MSHVALRKESVDRNSIVLASIRAYTVALRKESVDRNYIIKITETAPRVALRKESVDRNNGRLRAVQNTKMSLSARRAWIEITENEVLTNEEQSRSPQGERG